MYIAYYIFTIVLLGLIVTAVIFFIVYKIPDFLKRRHETTEETEIRKAKELNAQLKGEALEREFLYGVLRLIILCIPIIFISFFIAATLKLSLPVSLKIFIISGIGIIAHYMWSLQDSIKEKIKIQKQILSFIRMIFISVEMKRLDPENQEPARDILKNDLYNEQTYRDIDQRLEPPVRKIFYVLLAIAIIICSGFIFWKWDKITEFLRLI